MPRDKADAARRTPTSPRASRKPQPDAQVGKRRLREIDLLALLTIALVLALGVVSRDALSPDGVSYLDLAAVLRHGDVGHFVQGYWSPLYPIILAVGAAVDNSWLAASPRARHQCAHRRCSRRAALAHAAPDG